MNDDGGLHYRRSRPRKARGHIRGRINGFVLSIVSQMISTH